MPASVDLVAVTDLVEAMTAGDVPAATDPADVRTPGAWIRQVGVSLDRLDGATHKLLIHLVVPDNGFDRSRTALLTLFNQLLTLLDPDEDPYYQRLKLPAGDTLPGLVVPYNLPDDYRYEPEE